MSVVIQQNGQALGVVQRAAILHFGSFISVMA
jgi:hypothetical protein